MTTTKQFKTAHSLSDSAFKRLQDKIKLEYPDQMLTRRINSTDWLIVDVALFEQVLRDRSPDSSLKSESTSQTVPQNQPVSGSYLPVGNLAFNSDSTPAKGDSGSLSDVNQDLAQIGFNGENLKDFRAFLEMTNRAMTQYQNGLIDGTEEISSQVSEANEMLIETRAIYERTRAVEIIAKVNREGLNAEMGKTAANVIDFSQRLKQRSQ